MVRYFCFLLLVIPFSAKGQGFVMDLSSDTQDWTARSFSFPEPISAHIPGTFVTDLLRNHRISDPFLQDFEKDCSFLEKEKIIYRTSFEISKDLDSFPHCEMVWQGLDTYADVLLNGQSILRSNNMFRVYSLDVRTVLQHGTNTIEVIFFPASDSGKKLAQAYPYHLPGDEKVFTRKAQYQYGWDWGPRILSSGIGKSPYLHFWKHAYIQDCRIRQDSLSAEKAVLTLHATIISDKDTTIRWKLEKPSEGYIDEEIPLKKGTNKIAHTFQLFKPQLWWTRELGAQNLYDFEVKLGGNEPIDTQKLTIGLRTIELVQQSDKAGKTFYFKLNGKPLFIKGVNWIPAESFPARVSPNRYDSLLASANAVGMNMLRVWGGGCYEDDVFYTLCDKRGILVWQDFMFACAMYPGDTAFQENVRAEIRENVVRLRNHPSIVLWCGNNEIAEGWYNWGWQKQYHYSAQDSAHIWADYVNLFEKMIPEILAEVDDTRPYHPSSPANGWGRAKAYTEGDVHYWGVWWGLADYRTYQEKVGRFVSEYGMQAFPDWETLLSFTAPKQRRLKSAVLQAHQKHPTGFQNLDTYLKRDFLPRYFSLKSRFRPPETTLFQYSYLTQILQAEAVGTAIEAHRAAKPYCMGTMYWQLNDCWPGITWSSIDYFGKWKALHYKLRNVYGTCLITSTTRNEKIILGITSDIQKDTSCLLTIVWKDFHGKILLEEKKTVRVGENTAEIYWEMPLPPKKLRKSTYLYITLQNHTSTQPLTEKYIDFLPLKKQKLPKSSLAVRRNSQISEEYDVLQIRAESLQKYVYVYIPNMTYSLADNYFHLQAGETKEVRIPKGTDAGKIQIFSYNSL